MANHLNGEVEIEAGGKKLKLRFSNNDVISFQNAAGYADKDAEFMAAFIAGAFLKSFKWLRLMMKHALLCRQPETTDEEAGDVVTELGLIEAREKLSEAMYWMLPGKGSATNKGGKPRPSSGPTS